MIDCSKTKDYFAEKLRMTKKHKLINPPFGGGYICELNCAYCPLSSSNNGSSDMMTCSDFETIYPQKAIELVQKWSNEHPPKTLLKEFLKHYPKTELNSVGCPNIAPCELGIIKLKDECKYRNVYCFQCKDCWNTIVNDEDDEKD